MSVRRNSLGNRSASTGRQHQSRSYIDNSNTDSSPKNNALPNVLPELIKAVRKFLPQELPFNMQVGDVEYLENGYERLMGTLYMTTFRLVFAPDQEIEDNNLISTGNKYIGEYDIPLASIYKINVAPVDTRSGFKSFLNDNQIQSETRTFTLITRDFRSIIFTKCSITKSNTNWGKHQQASVTKMETYIDALKFHSRFQSREQLYPYLAMQQNSSNNSASRMSRGHPLSTTANMRSVDADIADFCLSNDERIKSYMTFYDWRDELYEASEQQWVVDRRKFDKQCVANDDGPYVCLTNDNDYDGPGDLIWHWTHTSHIEHDQHNKRQVQAQKYVLITVSGIGEVVSAVEPLRRAVTDTALVSSPHYICEQPFQRYNLSKFPCNLKRLQTSYEKLSEICITTSDDDDEKWWTKLNTCKWLKYVSKALHGAASLAKLLDFKNIELAGSDTDNSCLMSSLIQILLRPKCRTIKGFCELIVREWLIRGHKFRERFGQVLYDANGYSSQESPVFLLFLDCVHQLVVQNPFLFEFTDYFLLEIYRDICYCYHHTFVFNNVIERLEAIHYCPKDLLVLSSFDFSLYLYPDACRLLKNDASIFNLQKSSSSSSSSQQQIKPRIEATVIYPSSESPRRPNRTVYYLETSKATNFTLDIPVTTRPTIINAEQYEYDTIESPQIFQGDFHIDWRTFNLVLWSKCYCRYDQNNIPTLREQQLSMEINCLQEDIEKIYAKSKRQITLDTFHFFGNANSWHPQALDTRV